jgi:hypothetical protein
MGNDNFDMAAFEFNPLSFLNVSIFLVANMKRETFRILRTTLKNSEARFVSRRKES